MKKLFFIFASILLWASCSNQDEPVNQAPEAAESQTSSRYLSPSEAVKRASEAYGNMFGKGSRSTLSGQAYLYNTSTGSRSLGTDSVLYVVNFDEGGFAVVPACRYDDTEAYAIGEHSTFDASQNPAAAAYVDNLSGYASSLRDSLLRPGINPGEQYILPWMGGIPEGWSRDPKDPAYWFHTVKDTREYDKAVVTKWHQDDPYNKYCPIVFRKGKNVHAYAGCVAVALGQLSGYYRTPANQIDGYTLDWDEILDFPLAIGLNEEYQNQIAHLLRQIGIKANLKYKTDATSGSATGCLTAAKALGFSTAKYDNSFYNCMNYLSESGPCLVLGTNNENKGHAWIIDGIKITRNNKYRAHCSNISDEQPYSINENYYIRCNWGWGSNCDGYYLYLNKKYIPEDLSYTGQSEWKNNNYDLHYTDSTYVYNSSLSFLINLK